MKKLILVSLLVLTGASASLANLTNDVLVCTNLFVYGPGYGNSTPGTVAVSKGSMDVGNVANPQVSFTQIGDGGANHAVSGLIALIQDFDGVNWQGRLNLGYNVGVFNNLTVGGNISCLGTVSAATTILWQTNVVWATNSFYSIYATNTPDLQPIPWKAGTNVWTGTNTYSGTVNLNGPVKVNGAGGGTSNVPMGGVTFHFVNGFYTGATTP